MTDQTQRDLGDENDHSARLERVINRLEAMPKQGESYDHKGRHGWANPIRSDTGPFLKWFTGLVKPKRVLEIGAAHGLSLCHIGSGAPSAELTTIEWDENRAKDAQANLNEAGLNAKVHCGDALQILDDELSGQFDLVFLDANKDGYLEQFLKLQVRGLVAPGTWVLADNVKDRQAECQNFLDHISQGNYASVNLPTECGLLVVQL